MSAIDDIIAKGIALVHASKCPACSLSQDDAPLDANPSDGFHYHGAETTEPARLWCHSCGQGYRIYRNELLITVPCNGGLHPGDLFIPAGESPRFA